MKKLLSWLLLVIAGGATALSQTEISEGSPIPSIGHLNGTPDQLLTNPVAAWDFYGIPSASPPATCTATIFDANLTGTGLITRGPGAPPSGAANSFRTTGFQNNGVGVGNTDYFEINLGASPGYSLSLSTIDARFGGTASFYAAPGVTSQYGYSLDGINFILIGNPVTSTALTTASIDLTQIPSLQNVASGVTVTIRYYASGQTTTGGWGFYSSSPGNYGLAIGGSLNSLATTGIYTWNQTNAGNWNDPANWTPPRTSPLNSDFLVFDNGGSCIITGVPIQTVGGMKITGSTAVILQSETAITLTIAGGAGTDFEVGAGSILSLGGTNAITLALGSGATASVSGSVTFTNSSSAANRFTGNDPESILFHGGSLFSTGMFQSGPPFGTASTGAVVFESGSVLLHQSGSNPFGAPQPGSATVFQTGSLYKVTGNVSLSFSGRTYADMEIDAPGITLTATGSNPVLVDNLTVTNGSLNFNVTGSPGHSIKGTIHAAAGTSLCFNPASPGTIRLAGTSNQIITGTGMITSGTHSILEIANDFGITLDATLTLEGSVKFTQGLLTLGSGDLILGTLSQVTGSPSAASMVTFNGTGHFRKRFPAVSSFTFPVGTITGTPGYSPVTLTLSDGIFGSNGWVGVDVVNAKYPGDTNTGNFLNRYWELTASDITSLQGSAQFYYPPSDVTGSEALISCVRVHPEPFTLYAPTDITLHRLQASGLLALGIFTGSQVSPSLFQVSGSGVYCEGSSGLPVTLSESQPYVTYQLKKNGMDSGAPVEGTGSMLSWPDQTTGIYSVTATNSSGSVLMNGTAVIDMGVPVVPSVSIEASSNLLCAGTPVTITATPTNGGQNPVYQWSLNNNPTGQNSPIYTCLPGNNDQISCTMTSDLECVIGNPAYSNTLSMAVNPLVTATVTITASDSVLCEGNPVTFTATPVNGGPDPLYQWMVNNLNTGNGGPVFTYTPVDHDLVSCVMTSGLACVTCNPAVSNPVQLHVNPLSPAAVTITASATSVCSGTSVTFNAVPVNGGATPQYAWRVNGAVTGPDNPMFTYLPQDGDQVACEMTSGLNCVSGNPALSNVITMTVTPVLTAGITIQATASAVCEGSEVEFTALPVNGGTQPSYQWKVNGINAGGNSPLFSYVPADGDVVVCSLNSNMSCITGNPVTSNAIMLTVNPVIPVGISIFASANNICEGNPVTFTAVPMNGGNTPVYQWNINGVAAGSNSAVLIHMPANGDVIACSMIPDEACPSSSPALSNAIVMSVQQQAQVAVSVSALQTTLCAGSEAVFHATATNGGSQPVFQWMVNGTSQGNNSPDFSYFPSDNDGIACSLTSSQPCSSGNPAVSNQIVLHVSQLASVSVSVIASANPVIAGTSVTFTAIPVNGGSSPDFQWMVNGVNAGINHPVFNYVPVNNDVITCRMTSHDSCTTGNPALSNEVVMTVNCTIPLSLSISGIVGSGIDSVYRASQFITVSGENNPLIVQNGGQVTMLTGGTIYYRPGTRVETGGYLHGDIVPAMLHCGEQAPALMATVNPEQRQMNRQGDFLVYPNPTNSDITLEIPAYQNEGRIVAEIHSIGGVKLFNVDITGEAWHEFDLSTLPAGLYLMKIVTGKRTGILKIIKH